MKLLCRNNITLVYDAGENYLVETESKNDILISKKDNITYPLACCLKWGMEPVDIEYLNNLFFSKFTQK